MSKSNWRFKQTDIQRAVKAFERLGYDVRGCKITPDNTIEVLVGEHEAATTANPWDNVLKKGNDAD